MFRYVVESPAHADNRKAYVLPLSIVTHLVVVALAAVVPLCAPGVLPVPATTVVEFISREVPTVPPPPPPAPVDRAASEARTIAQDVNPLTAPIVAPPAIAPEGVVGDTTRGLIQGVESGIGNVADGVLGSAVAVPPPPPPEPTAPLRVGGAITRPKKIRNVAPVYPAIAQVARVSGTVIIEATIGPTGDVLDARVLRSVPLLDAAALEAVRRWQFTPTLLNGKAIAVVMSVTVDFRLQ